MSNSLNSSNGRRNMEDTSLTLQKMVFIYNALQSGYSVKKIDTDKYEFEKNLEKNEMDLKDYLRRFVQYNMDIDNIIEK